jgi:hypothetical protein
VAAALPVDAAMAGISLFANTREVLKMPFHLMDPEQRRAYAEIYKNIHMYNNGHPTRNGYTFYGWAANTIMLRSVKELHEVKKLHEVGTQGYGLNAETKHHPIRPHHKFRPVIYANANIYHKRDENGQELFAVGPEVVTKLSTNTTGKLLPDKDGYMTVPVQLEEDPGKRVGFYQISSTFAVDLPPNFSLPVVKKGYYGYIYVYNSGHPEENGFPSVCGRTHQDMILQKSAAEWKQNPGLDALPFLSEHIIELKEGITKGGKTRIGRFDIGDSKQPLLIPAGSKIYTQYPPSPQTYAVEVKNGDRGFFSVLVDIVRTEKRYVYDIKNPEHIEPVFQPVATSNDPTSAAAASMSAASNPTI